MSWTATAAAQRVQAKAQSTAARMRKAIVTGSMVYAYPAWSPENPITFLCILAALLLVVAVILLTPPRR